MLLDRFVFCREQAASQILDAQRQGPKERKRLLEKQKQARPKGEAAKVFDPAPEVKRVARTVPSTEVTQTLTALALGRWFCHGACAKVSWNCMGSLLVQYSFV